MIFIRFILACIFCLLISSSCNALTYKAPQNDQNDLIDALNDVNRHIREVKTRLRKEKLRSPKYLKKDQRGVRANNISSDKRELANLKKKRSSILIALHSPGNVSIDDRSKPKLLRSNQEKPVPAKRPAKKSLIY